MKPTLLFATLSMVLAAPATVAQSELETLRLRCSEQERQIRQLEAENAQLRAPSSQSERPPTVPAAAPSATTYTVKAGDSLAKIARQVGATVETLAKANSLETSAIIRLGQKLKVPATSTATTSSSSPKPAGKTHTVQAGDTFSSISRKYGMSAESLIAANPTVKPSALRPGQVVSLGGDEVATVSAAKAPAPAEQPPAAPEAQPVISSTEAPIAEQESQALGFHSVLTDGRMTYGEFAAKHGTNCDRLNQLNNWDFAPERVFVQDSEIYVPDLP